MPRIEFGADGIRGRVGEWPFVSPVAVSIGQALGRFVFERSASPFAVIGRDTRPSGESFLHCLTAGLASQGVHVIDLGVVTTPGIAFLTRRLHADLGVIVSASHNPLEYNGIKLVRQNGLRLQREDEIVIESLIEEFITTPHKYAPVLGQETDGEHLLELYIQDHVGHCPVPSLAGFRVVLDCADGAAAEVAPETFRRLGADVLAINTAVEGSSINYQCGSEHVREQPQALLQAMRQHGAPYGFAFDGDGDRLVVVDAAGRVYDGHDLLFVLAAHFQARGHLRGDAVVTIHQANRGLADALRQLGIQTLYTDNGDRNVEAAMWGGDYLLGGEPGGNLVINDGHHAAADAIYAALVLSGVLVQSQGTSLAEMAAPLRKRPQVTRSLRLPAPFTLAQEAVLRAEARRQEGELGPDSRILVWQSHTEPGVVRAMVEGAGGNTLADTEDTADLLCQFIQRFAEESRSVGAPPDRPAEPDSAPPAKENP
jgi:phosphoglucosamine mutase